MRLVTALIALSVWVPMLGLAADPPPALDRDALIARIRAESVAVEAAEADYARRRDAGTMAPAEAIDYADYVERLGAKVAQDCSDLAEHWAEPVPSDLPCSQRAVAVKTLATRSGSSISSVSHATSAPLENVQLNPHNI